MKTISIINLKGGVGKSVSAINIADVLASRGKSVLLVDNDMQGNTSKFFNRHGYDAPSISDILTVKGCKMADVVRATEYPRLDVLPANMTLLEANKRMLMDVSWVQHTRLRKALAQVSDVYDCCVIDNSPYIDLSVINALVASDDVLVPIKVDRFALDGLAQLVEQVEQVRELNPGIRIVGGFQTMYQPDRINRQGSDALHSDAMPIPVFNTRIRKTTRVDQSTFTGVPLNREKRPCTAARDYVDLVDEYLMRANV